MFVVIKKSHSSTATAANAVKLTELKVFKELKICLTLFEFLKSRRNCQSFAKLLREVPKSQIQMNVWWAVALIHLTILFRSAKGFRFSKKKKMV